MPKAWSGHPAAGPRGAALQRAALVLAHPAPDAGVLAAFQRPLQALDDHVAPAAYGLGILDLQQRGPGVPDGEEELWVLVTAGSAVAPVHGGPSLGVSRVRVYGAGDADARGPSRSPRSWRVRRRPV